MAEKPIRTFFTDELECRSYADRSYKRSLNADEISARQGEDTGYVPPPPAFKRLWNEAACLELVRSRTDVPVPEVLEAYEENGSFILVQKRVPGIPMCRVPEGARAAVMDEVQAHMDALHTLRSDTIGGPLGFVCPPRRAMLGAPPALHLEEWPPLTAAGPDFVFCHNTLSTQNILIDEDAPKVAAIFGWQYAGFWPDFFDAPFFRDPRPSSVQSAHIPAENARLLRFFLDEILQQGLQTTGESLCRTPGPC